MKTHFWLSALLSISVLPSFASAQTDVVAFWSFAENYDFSDPALPDGPNKLNFNQAAFPSIIDNTVSATANLQGYLGNAAQLDDNGGGGFVPYTSPVGGLTFAPTRTLKFDDLRGAGNNFDIGGVDIFQVDRLDGAGPLPDDFGNDALIYITLNGTGFQDFQLRFDVEGTPGFDDPADPAFDPLATDLPESFDLFYRTTGPGGTWFRDPSQNNIPLVFSDLDPANPDPDNQVADSGFVALDAALNNASQIEIIIRDFEEGGGNNELELDNIEIVANIVPAPTCLLGDASGNGIVDFNDIPPFVDALLMGIFSCEVDCNEDGLIDFNDIPSFVDILLNGSL